MNCPLLKLSKKPFFTTHLLVESHIPTFSEKQQQHCLRSANISRIDAYCSLLLWLNSPLAVIECSLHCSFAIVMVKARVDAEYREKYRERYRARY